MGIILGQIIGHTRQPRMHIAAAQIFGADHLAGRSFHQGGAGQKDRALILHDDRDIRHRWHIGPACRARAHDDSDLRNACRRHLRLVIEDPAEVIAVGKNLVLIGQVRAPAIDKVDGGKAALRSDLLRAQVLFDRNREIGAAFHRGIVADHHDLPPFDLSDTGDQPCAGCGTIMQIMARQCPDFEERRARIKQVRHPRARQHLAARDMAITRLGPATIGGQGRGLCDLVQGG